MNILAGKRVVDVTSSLAGPTCGQLLAALGADVVKVEPPGGDPMRSYPELFESLNAGKRSLVLDLSTAEGLAQLLELVDDSDVLVQSLRPGAAEMHGFGPDAVRTRNPSIVYCSIGAFGARGPLRDQPGYDPLLQAASGIMSVTGTQDGPPVRVGVSLIDLATGLWAAFGILAALERGEGCVVDVSLYETALWLLSYQLVGYLGAGELPAREGSAFAQIAPYQVFETRDGELMIVAGNDKLFRGLCEVLDLPSEDRFATNPQRVRARAELAALIEARTRTWATDELLDALVAAGIPASPVRDVGEAARHEQTVALGILQQLGDLTTVAHPLSFDGERLLHPSPPPPLAR